MPRVGKGTENGGLAEQWQNNGTAHFMPCSASRLVKMQVNGLVKAGRGIRLPNEPLVGSPNGRCSV